MTQNDLKFMPDFYDRYITLVDQNTALIPGLLNAKEDIAHSKEEVFTYENFQYQPGKWTPKEVVQHVIDNERIQVYRALVFSRNDNVILPGYDQDLYVSNASTSHREMEDVWIEFQTVRAASISFFKSLTVAQLHREGICSGIKVTPLALGFMLIGHQIHHVNVLKERYFN